VLALYIWEKVASIGLMILGILNEAN